MSETKQNAGRIMAIDLGEKRIGIAVSDPTRLLARAYTVLERRSRREDFDRIRQIIEQEGIVQIVMGLPIMLSGEEGRMATWVRDYSADLQQQLEVDLTFWDESFTSAQAEASLRARGKRAHQQRGWVDAVAAAFILQSYLDAQADDLPLPPA